MTFLGFTKRFKRHTIANFDGVAMCQKLSISVLKIVRCTKNSTLTRLVLSLKGESSSHVGW